MELEAQDGYWDNESAYPNRVTFETPIKARYFKYEVVEWYGGWGAIWDFTLYTSVDTKAAPAPTNAEPVVSQEVMWTVEGANSADTKVDEKRHAHHRHRRNGGTALRYGNFCSRSDEV